MTAKVTNSATAGLSPVADIKVLLFKASHHPLMVTSLGSGALLESLLQVSPVLALLG